ncbi:ATP-binding protein [Sulfurimonas sp.]|uniref:ATP-binding protein n=1 Tax=Sulfurimonas sp. TaxID=2022749 RepID=UPI002B460D63|nr:ATP-binding protein [Sulfurimonas sp.]
MNLTIKQKLFIITILPLSVFLIFSFNFINDNYKLLKSNENFLIHAKLIEKSSKLIHELQIERGLNSAYLTNKDKYFYTKIKLHRIFTDKSIELFTSKIKYNKFLTPTQLSLFYSSKKITLEIKKIRIKIDNLTISAEDNFKIYTKYNYLLLELINSLRLSLNNERIFAYIVALETLLDFQEMAGQERGFIFQILDKGVLSSNDTYIFNFLNIQQEEKFKYIQTTLKNTQFSEKLKDILTKHKNSYIHSVKIRLKENKQLFGIDSKRWFNATTLRINDYHNLELILFDSIYIKIKQDQARIKNKFFLEIISTLTVILILLFTNLLLANKIRYSMTQLNDGIKEFFKFLNFKRGLPEPIETDSYDEINDMAQDINKEMLLLDKNLNLDASFINEATHIVKLMQDGNFLQRPYIDPNNPSLIELKSVLNKLMELISNKIKEQTTSLKRLNSSLEDKVFTQTLELHKQIKTVTSARDEAIKAQLVKDAFIANISHEIRTPLNAILGFVSILQKQIKEEKDLNYLNIINESGKSLLTIINDILDFSKLQSGQFKIETYSIQTIDEFSNAVMLFTSKAYEKHIIYTAFIDPNISENISIDAIRVKQILSNLLSNAMKFTPNYGEVKVSITIKNSKLCISIQDSGIGISTKEQLKIFSPFEQADNSTTRNFGGTGLGLSISLNLAKLMDGDITLQSTKGEGSTFTLNLPIQVVQEKSKELTNRKTFANLRFALLSISEESKSIVSLIKKYLLSFGAINIIEITKYQSDGYDVLFFTPEEEYNANIIDTKIPAVALLKIDTIILDNSSYCKPLYAPFLPNNIVQVLNQVGIKNINTPYKKDLILDINETKQYKGNILVAEDNKTNQMLISLLLEDYGIKYKIVKDGMEAVKMFKNEKYNMVLMDENMPNLSGIEAMLEIKDYEKENSLDFTPIVALTASALDSDKERFLKAGMDGFIAKPIDTNILESELKKYLTVV